MASTGVAAGRAQGPAGAAGGKRRAGISSGLRRYRATTNRARVTVSPSRAAPHTRPVREAPCPPRTRSRPRLGRQRRAGRWRAPPPRGLWRRRRRHITASGEASVSWTRATPEAGLGSMRRATPVASGGSDSAATGSGVPVRNTPSLSGFPTTRAETTNRPPFCSRSAATTYSTSECTGARLPERPRLAPVVGAVDVPPCHHRQRALRKAHRRHGTNRPLPPTPPSGASHSVCRSDHVSPPSSLTHAW